MRLSTSVTVKCAQCSKTVQVTGPDVTYSQVYQDIRKKGWQWKSFKVQLCPDHAFQGAAKKPKAAKPKKVKVAKKKPAVKRAKKSKSGVLPPSAAIASSASRSPEIEDLED